jgi:hypothetical protein
VQALAGSGTLAAMVSPVDGMITAGDTCGTALLRSGMNNELVVRIIGVKPNPASSSLDLHLHSASNTNANITFVSMLGQTVTNIPVQLNAGDQVIPITQLPERSGVYEMLISSGAAVVRERVEILR